MKPRAKQKYPELWFASSLFLFEGDQLVIAFPNGDIHFCDHSNKWCEDGHVTREMMMGATYMWELIGEIK